METLWNLLNADALASLPLGWALLGLFALAMAAATLLPLGSEAAVLALAHAHGGGLSGTTGLIWLAATLGNTAGGLVTYAMGRAAHRVADDWRSESAQAANSSDSAAASEAPHASPARNTQLAVRWVHAHDAWALLLSWLPVVGDALCAAAGWLRLPAGACALAIAAGKGARYAALLWLFS